MVLRKRAGHTREVMETTGKKLVEHWNWAAEKGLMNKNTALGLRAACSQVLGVLDDWESVDIEALKVEDTLTRFQNLSKNKFKPAVLETYKRRFRQAVASFLSYHADPGGWKPKMLDRPVRGERSESAERSIQAKARPAQHEITQSGFVEYPFPLRDGFTARLTLPRDLTSAEVKRMTAFMWTLAVDFDSANPAA